MIASVTVAGVRRAPEFSSPDDECFLQQAARLQILEERRDSLIGNHRIGLMAMLQVAVLVPRSVVAE